MMDNLFGEPMESEPKRKPPDKQRKAWEDAFQRWSNKHSMDGTTPTGCCGYGSMCDYCEDNSYGRPCVRALNAMCKAKRLRIDYTDRNFERWWEL